MYEFEFWDEEHQEFVYFYAYSVKDLKCRYPEEDFDKYKLTLMEYVD